NPGGTAESNNRAQTTVSSVLAAYPDLTVSQLAVQPVAPRSGDVLAVSWRINNSGNGAVDRSFFQQLQVVNLDNGQTLAAKTVAYDPLQQGTLAAGQERDLQAVLQLPPGSVSVGQLEFTLVLDAAGEIYEFRPGTDAEANNTGILTATATLADYPDLAVSAVQAPALTIGDPGQATVTWTVTNAGTGQATPPDWTDAIVLSTDAVAGDQDDRVLARFAHTGGLNPGVPYTRSETLVLPPGLVGRFHLFVTTDVEEQVFENDRESNNTAAAGQPVDLMRIPYADLVVTSIQVPAEARSGQPLDLSWAVANQGLGLTSRGDWTDTVHLARDPAGTQLVSVPQGAGTVPWECEFGHMGHLAVGDSYTRTGTVVLPEGLEGTYYLVVTTGGPFEFLYTDNNTRVSAAVPVVLTPAPDLAVASIVAPQTVEEGDAIDVAWTVQNLGSGVAAGSWIDQVYLQQVGDPNAAKIQLGKFQYQGPLPAGMSYSRSEQLTLPSHINDLYQIVVTTNFDDAVYEHGATANNRRVHDLPLAVSIQPRPDLQVFSITAPAQVDAGGTFSVEFVVINQGTAATSVPFWSDRVYLSLDNEVTPDDVLISELQNQSALGPGERYLSVSGTVQVPQRFRGDVFVLVVTDAKQQIDEWPNDGNNVRAVPLHVVPLPLADLVTNQVIAPAQAVEGADIEVRYTVTNRGSGETNIGQWNDTIWLTRDKNRPHPGQGDVLLKTLEHTGSLAIGAGYDQTVTVTLPKDLSSGTYYITPWTDPYDVVLEDTLATNVNPDDPHEIDNNNYRARAIGIIGLVLRPDLVVQAVTATDAAQGGEEFTVSWTVKNQGHAETTSATWLDRIYLCDGPDPLAPGATALELAAIPHAASLAPGQQYTETRKIGLSPSAAGAYVVVIADAGRVLKEEREDNNQRAAATQVTPVPADLQVTQIIVPPANKSGEKVALKYTVTNTGSHAVWAGTQFWTDYIWLSADSTFVPERATYLGSFVHSQSQPLQPGASYQVDFDATLPTGIGGDYHFYIHLDAHNDTGYLEDRVLQTDWWPADGSSANGVWVSNDNWVKYFQRWAYEDPRNNLARAAVSVTYYEPDLRVSQLVVPATASSGQTVPVSFTVT
ncbi:MAG: hypothetical protein MUF25_19485, partial [Pirellulaceae bacterium]|nr:hypothetical protein [Pirellulaceae bacterium]